jgi:hypothetical protein
MKTSNKILLGGFGFLVTVMLILAIQLRVLY